jgi:uncharacterized membrane protein YkvA (DUF1232 family)
MMLLKLKQRAKELKRELYALYLAYRHLQTPWYAKVFIICVVAYAISPVDLIPDFIPIFGYLDDLILLPLGISLALKMIPPEVMSECRAKAQTQLQIQSKVAWIAAAFIGLVWILALVWVAQYLFRRFYAGTSIRHS